VQPGAIQPATPVRTQVAQPIMPEAPRSAALQAQAGNAFALPANFSLKPRGSGQPLPEPIQNKMESCFNTSFADVRVHVGHEAPSIGALAFTHGSDLYFAPGQYNPQSFQGQQLLGHELTHVVQQRAGRVRNPLGSGVAVVQDPALEAEAERMGQRAASATTPIQPKPAVGGPIATRSRGTNSRPATVTANGAILPAKAAAHGSVSSGSNAGLPIRPSASPIRRADGVSSAGSKGLTFTAPGPILPSNAQVQRAALQKRGPTVPRYPSASQAPTGNPYMLRLANSTLQLRIACHIGSGGALASVGRPVGASSLQPKPLSPTIPSAAGSSFVIQRVNWNALTHSQNGLYGINHAAPPTTKLYGQLAAPDPQPVALYHRTLEDDTSNGTPLARPKVKVWEANVRFFNKAIRGPNGLPIPGRTVDIPGSVDDLDDPARRAVIGPLSRESSRAVDDLGPVGGIGATLGVVGINDCASFAALLQKLIFQASGNAHVDQAAVRFDQGDYNHLPVAGIGDYILQQFGRGATSEAHGVTVVAADGTTLVTLEAHVEQNLTKPAFHFYAGTAGFFRENNSGPAGVDQFLAMNRVKGQITNVLSATSHAVDQDSIAYYDPLRASGDLAEQLQGIRGRLNLWVVHEKYRLTSDSNFRRSDRDHSIIRALPKGTVVSVLDKNRRGNEFSLGGLSSSKRHWWVQYRGLEGWVTAHTLAPLREYTTTSASNLRRPDRSVIESLPKGTTVTVLDKNRAGNEFSLGGLSSSKRHWWVQYGGREGWVTANTLTRHR
jgi:hypothetical protein